jgi:Flavodoxin-like fold.
MAKVLVIKGTPQDENESRSLSVARIFIDEYNKWKPEDQFEEIDVYNIEIPLIDRIVLDGWKRLQESQPLLPEQEKKISAINKNTEQFMAADKYIFITPLWNLGVPPLVKAYIDNVCIAGKTFHYTEHGSVGDLKGKVAIHIHGAGGIYSDGVHVQHGDAYIRDVLGFLGIEVLPTIWVEGIDYNPSRKKEIMERAIQRAKLEVRDFAYR